MPSPYESQSIETWSNITKGLIAKHPLDVDTIREVALIAWGVLWQTKIGEGDISVRLDEIDVPATVVGYFFEKLFARELERKHPEQWRGSRSKEEKDIVYVPNPAFSIEMKSSGQIGTKVFGNRSYNQKAQEGSKISKIEKSGYYITINFNHQTLNLIRFGWIDLHDWKSQKSSTGQAATLADEVYTHKMIVIPGSYQLNNSVEILNGVGKKTLETFTAERISTIYDLLQYQGNNSMLMKFKEKANESYKVDNS